MSVSKMNPSDAPSEFRREGKQRMQRIHDLSGELAGVLLPIMKKYAEAGMGLQELCLSVGQLWYAQVFRWAADKNFKLGAPLQVDRQAVRDIESVAKDLAVIGFSVVSQKTGMDVQVKFYDGEGVPILALDPDLPSKGTAQS